MSTLYVTAATSRAFTSSGVTYLVPTGTLGEVVGASGAATTVDVQWDLAAEDASGTFAIATDVTEPSVPLSNVAAAVDAFALWT